MQPVPTKKEVIAVHVMQASRALGIVAMILMNIKINHVTPIQVAKTPSGRSNVLVRMDFRVIDSIV